MATLTYIIHFHFLLISDAHEWINEIPTVPIYYLANPQPRERAWNNRRGKKTLVSVSMKFQDTFSKIYDINKYTYIPPFLSSLPL